MKKFFKIISGGLGVLLFLCAVLVLFLIAGNPISYMIAWGTANQYIQENHADTDYKVKMIDYILGIYRVEVYSPTKQDERFHLTMDTGGAIINNNYDRWVDGRYTVKWRLIDEYSAQGQQAFASENISDLERLDFSLNFLEGGKPFQWSDCFKAHPNATHLKDIPLNTSKCTKEMSAANGLIDYREAMEGTPTYEQIAQNLLRIKSTADDAGFAFHAIKYELCNSQDWMDSIYVGFIYYEDIYEEGFVERIKQRKAEYDAYLAAT